MYGAYGAIAVIALFLMPGPWAFLYQAPTGFALAYFIARAQAPYDVEKRTLRVFALVCGVGGAALFTLLGLIGGVLMALLALAGMWMGTTYALDRYLETDLDSGHRIAGAICIPIWLTWICVGAAISTLLT